MSEETVTLVEELEAALKVASKTLEQCRKAYLDRLAITEPLHVAKNKALRLYGEDPLYDNHQAYMHAYHELKHALKLTAVAYEARKYAIAAHTEAWKAVDAIKRLHTA